MSGHTKVPLRASAGFVLDSDGFDFAQAKGGTASQIFAKARFIVLSANNHAALVEALAEAETVLARLDTLAVPFPVLINVRALLAKVSQEAGE